MDINKALGLKKSTDIRRAAVEAERRNVEHGIIRRLWTNYENALRGEWTSQ